MGASSHSLKGAEPPGGKASLKNLFHLLWSSQGGHRAWSAFAGQRVVLKWLIWQQAAQAAPAAAQTS